MADKRSILVVLATEMEHKAVAEALAHPKITTLITGVGMVATAAHLATAIANHRPRVVLNIGIAGAFHDELPVGSVVQVVQDRLSELGVEDNGSFIPMDASGLIPTDQLVYTTDVRLQGFEAVSGITVNRVHGSTDSIQAVRQLFHPHTESMEGAAVAYVCQMAQLPWVQVRAISNRVEPRDRSKWNIPLALANLRTQLPNILDQLHEA